MTGEGKRDSESGSANASPICSNAKDARVIRIANWSHDPKRRKARFRCQHCSRLIADGSDVVIERRPGGAHGYHAEHFTGWDAEAALARAARCAP